MIVIIITKVPEETGPQNEESNFCRISHALSRYLYLNHNPLHYVHTLDENNIYHIYHWNLPNRFRIISPVQSYYQKDSEYSMKCKILGRKGWSVRIRELHSSGLVDPTVKMDRRW